MSSIEHARRDALDEAQDQARLRAARTPARARNATHASCRILSSALISLAIVLSIWQGLAAMNVDPVLFTSPWKVAVAAVTWSEAASFGLRCGPVSSCLRWASTLAIVFGIAFLA